MAFIFVFNRRKANWTLKICSREFFLQACVIDVSVVNLLLVHVLEWDTFIIVSYRPPSYNDLEKDSLKTYPSELCIEKNVLLLGEFNLPSIKWDKFRQSCYIFRSFILRNIYGSWNNAASLWADIYYV